MMIFSLSRRPITGCLSLFVVSKQILDLLPNGSKEDGLPLVAAPFCFQKLVSAAIYLSPPIASASAFKTCWGLAVWNIKCSRIQCIRKANHDIGMVRYLIDQSVT